ncbi:MAG: IclR family transcriptional regulator [Stappiaceae bacterium]
MDARDKGHSFLRVYRIIEMVAGSEWPISYSEISERLDLSKPSAHRLCEMLESNSIIVRALDGKSYRPGPRLRALSMDILGGSALQLERQLILRSVSEKTGETCNITVPDGMEMLYLDRVETAWPLRISMPAGSRVPLHCTASGKLYLSQLASRERKKLISSLDLKSYTKNTITDSGKLIEQLKTIRQQQVGTDDQEFIDEMISVSVPINDPLGRICATIAVHGPISRLPFEKALSHLPVLREAAAQLETTIGAGPGT